MNLNSSRNRSSLRIFSCSGNPELANLIARKVGVKVSPIQSTKFSNKEINVRISETIRSQNVYIIQSGGAGRNPNDDLMELMLLINACKLASAATISLILPMFPYSQGNKKNGTRAPISCRLMADLLQKAGASHIMMLDPHTPQLEGFFGVPVDSLKMEALICDWIRRRVPNWQECMVVSPNEDSVHQGISLANNLGVHYALIHNRFKKPRQCKEESVSKTDKDLKGFINDCQTNGPYSSDVIRDDEDDEGIKDNKEDLESQDTEDIEDDDDDSFSNPSIYFDDESTISTKVSGKSIILYDDMIDSGASMSHALKLLKRAEARNVYVFATHGLFSGKAVSRIFEYEDIIEAVVVSNSLYLSKEILNIPKLKVIDVSGLISEFIRRHHYKESVSVLSNFLSIRDDGNQGLPLREEESLLNTSRCDINSVEGSISSNGKNNCLSPTSEAARRLRKGFRLTSVCWE